MANNKKSDSGTGALAAEIGVGLLAAAAAAGTASYYFYASDGAKKHRKVAAKWAMDMKNEVVRQAKKAQSMSPQAYAAIVDAAAASYSTARNVRREDVMNAASELKKNWDKVRAEFDKGAQKARTRASAAKRSAKKVVKAAKKGAKKAQKTVAKAKKVAKKVVKRARR